MLCRKANKFQIAVPVKAGFQRKITVYGFQNNLGIAFSASFSTEQVRHLYGKIGNLAALLVFPWSTSQPYH